MVMAASALDGVAQRLPHPLIQTFMVADGSADDVAANEHEDADQKDDEKWITHGTSL